MKTRAASPLPHTASLPRKPLGNAKAVKFAEIEGMALNTASTTTLSLLQARGLHGDALRAAILNTFQSKLRG